MQPNRGKAAKRPLTDELSVRRVQSALVRYRDESLQNLLCTLGRHSSQLPSLVIPSSPDFSHECFEEIVRRYIDERKMHDDANECTFISTHRHATNKEEKQMFMLICIMVPLLVAYLFTTRLIASVK